MHSKSIAVFIIIVTMATLIGCSGTKGNNAEIISAENTKNISVVLFDGTEKTFDGNKIDALAEMINKATPTENSSVQDVPDALPLGKIIINDGEEVIYYYQKNSKYYIEKPYTYICETTVDINSFLSEL